MDKKFKCWGKKVVFLEAPSCGLGGSLQPPAKQLLFALVSSSHIKTGGTTKQKVSTRARTIFGESIQGVCENNERAKGT